MNGVRVSQSTTVMYQQGYWVVCVPVRGLVWIPLPYDKSERFMCMFTEPYLFRDAGREGV